jgi:hypothetical protein
MLEIMYQGEITTFRRVLNTEQAKKVIALFCENRKIGKIDVEYRFTQIYLGQPKYTWCSSSWGRTA